MRRFKKLILTIILFPIVIGSLTLSYLYVIQENQIFNFKTLDDDYQFQYGLPFEQVTLETKDSKIIGLHFKTQNPKGVVYYLHGKGSNLSFTKWDRIAKYTVEVLEHDVFFIDYRGFGKSKGEIYFEGLLSDAEAGYDYLKLIYGEEQITIHGLSLGTAFATHVASQNQPKRLILEAPFYNLFDVACSTLPFIPPFMIQAVIKYPFRTDLWIQNLSCPVFIFHGTADKIIPYDSSIRLAKLAKTPCDLTIIENAGHDHLNLTPEFREKIVTIMD